MEVKLFLVLYLIIFSMSLSAEEIEATPKAFEVSGTANTKYRRTTGRDRVQTSIILKIKFNLNNGWEVVGVGANGPEWGNGWDTVYDSAAEDEFENAKKVIRDFSFRNFYVSKALKYKNTQLKIQAGALDIETGLANATALERQGWIDGLRLKAFTKFGEITFSAGGIDELTTRNFFEREIDFNYYEIKMSKQVFEKLIMEVAAEHLNGELFLRSAAKYELDIIANRAVDLVAEVLYNTEDGTNKSSVGFAADLMNLLTGKASGIFVEFRHNHLSRDMGDRGIRLTSGLNTSIGDSASIAVGGPLNGKKTIFWYLLMRDNYDRDDLRIEVGVEVKFK